MTEQEILELLDNMIVRPADKVDYYWKARNDAIETAVMAIKTISTSRQAKKERAEAKRLRNPAPEIDALYLSPWV